MHGGIEGAPLPAHGPSVLGASGASLPQSETTSPGRSDKGLHMHKYFSSQIDDEVSGVHERGIKAPQVRIPGKTHLSAVLLIANPWESRDLERKLSKIKKERVQRERTLEWNQRQFFINQIFDQDMNLRFNQLLQDKNKKMHPGLPEETLTEPFPGHHPPPPDLTRSPYDPGGPLAAQSSSVLSGGQNSESGGGGGAGGGGAPPFLSLPRSHSTNPSRPGTQLSMVHGGGNTFPECTTEEGKEAEAEEVKKQLKNVRGKPKLQKKLSLASMGIFAPAAHQKPKTLQQDETPMKKPCQPERTTRKIKQGKRENGGEGHRGEGKKEGTERKEMGGEELVGPGRETQEESLPMFVAPQGERGQGVGAESESEKPNQETQSDIETQGKDSGKVLDDGEERREVSGDDSEGKDGTGLVEVGSGEQGAQGAGAGVRCRGRGRRGLMEMDLEELGARGNVRHFLYDEPVVMMRHETGGGVGVGVGGVRLPDIRVNNFTVEMPSPIQEEEEEDEVTVSGLITGSKATSGPGQGPGKTPVEQDNKVTPADLRLNLPRDLLSSEANTPVGLSPSTPSGLGHPYSGLSPSTPSGLGHPYSGLSPSTSGPSNPHPGLSPSTQPEASNSSLTLQVQQGLGLSHSSLNTPVHFSVQSGYSTPVNPGTLHSGISTPVLPPRTPSTNRTSSTKHESFSLSRENTTITLPDSGDHENDVTGDDGQSEASSSVLLDADVITRLTRTLPEGMMIRANQNVNRIIDRRKQRMLEKSRDHSTHDPMQDPRWKKLASSLSNNYVFE